MHYRSNVSIVQLIFLYIIIKNILAVKYKIKKLQFVFKEIFSFIE